jgi:hypothetical protein
MTTDADRPSRDEWDDEELAVELFQSVRSRARAAQCPAPRVVSAYRAGTLPPMLRQRVQHHIDHCAMCQMLDAAIDDTREELTREEHDRIAHGVRQQIARSKPPRRQWVGAAAAAVVVAAVGTGMWQFRSPATVQRILPIEKAPVRLPSSETELVWRGEANVTVAELSFALEPYRANDFASASDRLRELTTRFPADPRLQFYFGVTRLLTAESIRNSSARGTYAEAVAALEIADARAAADLELAREATWYLALAYERLGDDQRAAEKLRELCRSPGPGAERACAAESKFAAHYRPSVR